MKGFYISSRGLAPSGKFERTRDDLPHHEYVIPIWEPMLDQVIDTTWKVNRQDCGPYDTHVR